MQLLREDSRIVPSAESWYALITALDAAGQTAEANAASAEFERFARSQIDTPENANRALVAYYLGRGKNPAEALPGDLRTRRRQFVRRPSITTRV